MEDFVISKNKTGSIQAGGYKINSRIFNNPIEQSELSDGNTDKVSSLFKDLGIPAGILFVDSAPTSENVFRKEKGNYISSDLYENLLKLVKQTIPHKGGTKKRKKQKNNTTRRK